MSYYTQVFWCLQTFNKLHHLIKYSLPRDVLDINFYVFYFMKKTKFSPHKVRRAYRSLIDGMNLFIV